ncbi:MAG: glycine cleavage system aminomethyltransferase GcvT [Candidatus Hydrogenedentes bacterium]|nr:glycine cleavage system aminomethyltransferase GcvT [Candidatus Hydrogenedentota bacterium]
MQQTPLHDEHVAIGGKVVDFHGWALPVQYAGIIEEHHHTRAAASVFDCSHMGEFIIRGANALHSLNELLISDVLGLRAGRGRYGAILNGHGGIIDDVVSFKLAEDEVYLVTNAGPLDTVAALLAEAVPESENVSASTAKIDIQGPASRDALVRAGLGGIEALKYFAAGRFEWRGTPLVVSRAGYTGELGYELFVPNESVVALWRALLAIEPVKPAALGARDTLRTEVGYLLAGQDFDESRTPLEAGLDRFIAWETPFNGKDALLAKRDAGGYPVLTGIRTLDRRAPRHGFEVRKNGTVAGVVTSGTFGPSVGYGVGLAYVPRELAAPGTRLTAGPKEIEIETAEIPFYKNGTCRQD